MLPAFFNTATLPIPSFKRGATAAVLALSLAVPAPAVALDKHEQGILAGALGMLFVQGLINQSKQQPRAAAPVPMPNKAAPVYYAPRVTRTPAAYAFSSYTASERRAIQRSLARAGYYYGPVDGAFGPATYNATLDYARATGSAGAVNSQAGAYGVYDALLYSR